jgi:hypothetical protein
MKTSSHDLQFYLGTKCQAPSGFQVAELRKWGPFPFMTKDHEQTIACPYFENT